MLENRVLIIQEDFRERVEMTEALEQAGFKVDSVQSGSDAENAVFRQKFFLVVADIDTPEFSVLDFLNRINVEAPETKIMVVSLRPLVEEAVSLMKHGAFDFVVKPLSMEQLILTARHLMSKIVDSEKAANNDADTKSLPGRKNHIEIITCDKSMLRLLNLAKRVADSTASVLIQGESGTGKELFARFVHENSKRKNMPFVALNCAALPENLLESEMFGHEKGAFTGAVARKEGKFEIAHKGTLFLDEITEMQYHLQAKLLRVIQEKVVDRLGGTQPVEVDVRIVATTNRDVKESIRQNQFREDLYYRLNTIPLVIPPLRNRIGDLKLLCDYFIQKYTKIDARDVKGMTPEAFDLLSRQKFSGNVRELENIIHRAVLLAQDELIAPEDLMMEDFQTEFSEGTYKPSVAASGEKNDVVFSDNLSSSSVENTLNTGSANAGNALNTGNTANAENTTYGGSADNSPSNVENASYSGSADDSPSNTVNDPSLTPSTHSSSNPVIHPNDHLSSSSSENKANNDNPDDFYQKMPPSSLKEMEERMIFNTLDKTQGNRTHAAQILGISVRTLRNKLNEYKEKQ
ncbi:sigma-54-dependent transcriptional regulator [Desulfamplus magnetovallimortis]|nr:sigma-54 dependent transcriptional regulator [Desulfamplus magnetovallimortis]